MCPSDAREEQRPSYLQNNAMLWSTHRKKDEEEETKDNRS